MQKFIMFIMFIRKLQNIKKQWPDATLIQQ